MKILPSFIVRRKEKEKNLTKRNLPKEIRLSIKAGKEKKGENIVVIGLKEVSSFTDYFLLISGNSSRQNLAIYENIEKELKKEQLCLNAREITKFTWSMWTRTDVIPVRSV